MAGHDQDLGAKTLLTIDLRRASELLIENIGVDLQAPYVPGKTILRDELCARAALSQAEAEALCDSLERAGAIRFERSEVDGGSWLLSPWVEPPPAT